MQDIYETLARLQLPLRPVASPAAAYVPYVRSGHLVFLSGHLARRGGQVHVGRLGACMDVAQGQTAAREVGIDLLSTLHAAVGDLRKVVRIVKLTSLVHSTPDFTDQHLVTNGCSELMADVFHDAGRHARTAFGVAQLPLGACLEIELIAELA